MSCLGNISHTLLCAFRLFTCVCSVAREELCDSQRLASLVADDMRAQLQQHRLELAVRVCQTINTCEEVQTWCKIVLSSSMSCCNQHSTSCLVPGFHCDVGVWQAERSALEALQRSEVGLASERSILRGFAQSAATTFAGLLGNLAPRVSFFYIVCLYTQLFLILQSV
jgi:hypothetical protein